MKQVGRSHVGDVDRGEQDRLYILSIRGPYPSPAAYSCIVPMRERGAKTARPVLF